MALPAALLGILQGAGYAGQALAKDRERSEEKARLAKRDALAEQQLAETVRANRAREEAAQTDVGVLFKALGLPAQEGVSGRMPNTVATAAAAAAQKRAELERRQKIGRDIGATIPRSQDESTMAFTSPEEGSGMQPTVVPAEPRAAAIRRGLESGAIELEKALPFLFPKSEPVTDATIGYRNPLTGEISPVPGAAPVEPPPPAPGTVRSTTWDRRGRRTYTDKPEGRERTLSERLALAREQARINPGDPEAQRNLKRMEAAFEAEKELVGARAEGRVEALLDQPLSPDEAGALGVPFGTTRRQAQGGRPLLAAQRTKMDAQNSVLAMIDNMEAGLKEFSHPSGPADRLLKTPGRVLDVYGQGDPALTARHRQIEGTLALIVRAMGEVGTLTDKDIERARALQPTLAPIPDTEPVIAAKLAGLRQLVQEVAARTGNRPDAVRLGAPGGAGIGNRDAGAAPKAKARTVKLPSGKTVTVEQE